MKVFILEPIPGKGILDKMLAVCRKTSELDKYLLDYVAYELTDSCSIKLIQFDYSLLK